MPRLVITDRVALASRSRFAASVAGIRAKLLFCTKYCICCGFSSSLQVVFERYTERARQVVVLSQEEARTLNHPYIGTEHILLGLLREEEGLAAAVLEGRGITIERARAQVVRIVGSGDEPAQGQIPFTRKAKGVLENSLREALSLGHNYIGTEHVLLALVRPAGDEEDIAGRVFTALSVNLDEIRGDVLQRLATSKGTRTGRSVPARESDSQTTQREDASSEEPLSLEAVPTHADRPATEDTLGRVRLAEVLAERIRRVHGEDTERSVRGRTATRRKLRADRAALRKAEAFMIHVHAPWGAGKSSFLNFLGRDLRNVRSPRADPGRSRLANLFSRREQADAHLSQWIVVDFNAWEHQRLAPPWWWLLVAIRRSCKRELWRISRPRWLWFWCRDVGWRLWNSRVVWLSSILLLVLGVIGQAFDWFGLEADSLSALKAGAVSVSVLLTAGTAIWGRIHGTSRWLAIGSADAAAKFLRRAHDPLGVYRRRFRWLIRSAGRPVAVFIDDLDRCKPDYVVELLEGIQTLFAAEPVTYVVAADRTWLCESFTKVYCDFKGAVGDLGRPLGFLFLEKTFQISMEIPPMSTDDRQVFWEKLTRDGSENAEMVLQSRRSLEAAFAQADTHAAVDRRMRILLQDGVNKDDVLRAAVRKLNAPSLRAQLEDLLKPFEALLENNPRSMKRLINAYGIERDRLLREGRLPSPQERKKLVLFTILRLRWPLLAEHLMRHPEDVSFIGARNSRSDHPFRSLLDDRELRALFDGSKVGVALDRATLERHVGRNYSRQSSIGA